VQATLSGSVKPNVVLMLTSSPASSLSASSCEVWLSFPLLRPPRRRAIGLRIGVGL